MGMTSTQQPSDIGGISGIDLGYTPDDLRERTIARDKLPLNRVWRSRISGELVPGSTAWYAAIKEAILNPLREGVPSCSIAYWNRAKPEIKPGDYIEDLLTHLQAVYGRAANIEYGSYAASADQIFIVVDFEGLPPLH
jgi:hypothetical protein